MNDAIIDAISQGLVTYGCPVYSLNGSPHFVTDEVVIKFRPGTSDATRQGVLHKRPMTVLDDRGLGPDTVVVRASGSHVCPALALASAVEKTGLVEYACPDFMAEVSVNSP